MRALPHQGSVCDATVCNLENRIFALQGLDEGVVFITELFLGDSIGQSQFFLLLPLELQFIPASARYNSSDESSSSETDDSLMRIVEQDDLSMALTSFRGKMMLFATVSKTGNFHVCALIDPPDPAANTSRLDFKLVDVQLQIPFPFMVNFTPLDNTFLFASAGVGKTDFLFEFGKNAFVVKALPFRLLGGRNANSVCRLREDGGVVVVGGLTEEVSCTTQNDPEGVRHADVIVVYPKELRQLRVCSIPVGPRSAAGVALFMDRFVFGFGGFDGANDCVELFLCDLETGLSSTVRQTRVWPQRAFSSALIVKHRRLYILSDEFQGTAYYMPLVNVWRNIEQPALRDVFGKCLWKGWKSSLWPWTNVPKLKPGVQWLRHELTRDTLRILGDSGVLRM